MPEDHDVLEDLLQHRRIVHTYVYRRLADPHAVDDLVSEVYIVAWRRLAEIPRERQRAIGWLCGVGRNLIRNHVRGEVRRARLVERAAQQIVTSEGGRVHAGIAPGTERVEARESWGRLSADDRDLLALTLAGVPQTSIADRLGVRAGTVAMRLLRVRAHLHKREEVG